MGRLTKRIMKKFPNHTTEAIELNSEWGKMDIHANEEFYDIAQKLAHYEDLEEQGRLIEVIRCKDCADCREDTMFNVLYCQRDGNDVKPEHYCGFAKLKELKEAHFTDADKMGKE